MPDPSRSLLAQSKRRKYEAGAWVLFALWGFGAAVMLLTGHGWEAGFALFIALVIERSTRLRERRS
ncbi:MAG TPA: hypothetical protein VD948_01505 [Rhodothermales bacterium]|nr:hypothetical protein [Rhodothermales bacterium]